MILQESGEMYLETILVLSKTRETVRAVDVCEYMNFSKPSVSRAVGLLRDNGFLTVEKDGNLRLTAEGNVIAEKIYERHRILTAFLTAVGVGETTATEDACRMEHDISDETFEAIKKHYTEMNL